MLDPCMVLHNTVTMATCALPPSLFQLLKLEEVNEQLRMTRWHTANRGSLMSVLLHHTINH